MQKQVHVWRQKWALVLSYVVKIDIPITMTHASKCMFKKKHKIEATVFVYIFETWKKICFTSMKRNEKLRQTKDAMVNWDPTIVIVLVVVNFMAFSQINLM